MRSDMMISLKPSRHEWSSNEHSQSNYHDVASTWGIVDTWWYDDGVLEGEKNTKGGVKKLLLESLQ
jgi:hypothetical protein